MSQVAWPEMKRYGYEPKLGLCSIAAAGPLAILIPPSTPIIIYGILAQTSVGKLFMAGWLPWNPFDPPAVYHHGRFGQTQTRLGPARREDDSDGKASFLKAAWPILFLVCLYHGVHLGRHYHGE